MKTCMMSCCIGMVTLGLAASATATDSELIQAAERHLLRLAQGQYTDFLAGCDAAMQAALDEAKARQLWASLEAIGGKYQGKMSSSAAQGSKQTVLCELHFERMFITLRCVLDDQKRLSGLWIDERRPVTPYEPPAYVNQQAFSETRHALTPAAGIELRALLCMPTAPGKHPAVVLVHGSGPQDADQTVGPNRPLRDLAWGLASAGVATLRYEKRTLRHAHKADPAEVTLQWETIADAVAAAAWLRSQESVDPSRVFVLGHSLGGFAAPYIAQQDGKLAGLILLAANARPIHDLIEEQVAYLSRLDDVVSDEERAAQEQSAAAANAIRSGMFEDPAVVQLGAPAAYWKDMAQRDPVSAARTLTLPMLLVFCERDYQVTERCAQRWRAGLGDRPGTSFKHYAGLNHLLMAGTGKPNPDEYAKVGHVEARVVADIATWVQQPAAR